MSWASNHDGSLEKLHRVQASLTVNLIMVPRDAFQVCRVSDTAAEVDYRNKNRFSFLPVVDDRERVVGLYDAERWFQREAPNEVIAEDFIRLSEEIVIGANAGIFDFVRDADQFATKLVVSGSGVAGLISLSDIQQLPVRAALFSLITSLEMAMAMAIQRKWPDARLWLECLSEGRQQKLQDEIEKAKKLDGFVSELSFTQFSDKADLIRKADLLSGSKMRVKESLGEIRKLRDQIAHANGYADTPEEAKKVCRIVRAIYQLKEELIAYATEAHGEPGIA